MVLLGGVRRAAGVKYDGLMSPVAPHGPAAGKI